MEEGCAVAAEGEQQCSAVFFLEVVDGLDGGLDMGVVLRGVAEMLLSTLWLLLLLLPVATPSPDARRLYDDLLSNYNR